jgi:DNA-binding NarL/FixJ family response regulator
VSPPIRVLVADDQALVRTGFAMILDSYDGIEVVGEAADGVQALAMARELLPNVVLMDIRMPQMNGIETTRHLTTAPATAGVRVLVLTTFDADEYVFAALRAGASGFLLKDTPPAELIRAVQVINGGEALLSPSVTRRLIDRFTREELASAAPTDMKSTDAAGTAWGKDPPGGRAVLGGLTQREADVLHAVARGLSNVEIADEMFVSYSTVKTHVSHLLNKLGARDRAQLVMIAYRSGAMGPG